MISSRFFVITLLLLISYLGFGQKLRFGHYTVDNGLQNNIVFATVEDSKGLLWFATSTGIDRFDGKNFVGYPLPVKDNGYTSYVSVPFILADYQKKIWAASATNIYLYNVKKDVFELPSSLNKWMEKSKSITGMYAGNSGKNLLIGTNNTFFVYATEKDKLLSPDTFNGYVRFVFQDNKGIIWVSSNKGLQRYVINDNRLSELSSTPGFTNQIFPGIISGISQDENGHYWLFTADGRLFVYQENTNLIQQLNLNLRQGRPYAIKDIYHDPLQNTYVATDGGGMVLIDKNLTIQSVYQSNEDDLSSLSSNAVYDIFIDGNKRLWVTTYGGGVNVVTPTAQPFRNFYHEINNNNSLSNNAAKAITEDGKGQLWFGARKGVSMFDPLTGLWRHYNEDNSPAFTSDNVLALTSNKYSDIWAGTYGGGIVHINSASGAISSYRFSEKDTGSLGTDFVYTLLYDSRERLWAGGIRGPLSFLDTKTGIFKRLATSVASINCIIEDSQKDILLGTEKGVFVVRGDSVQNLFKENIKEKVLFLLEDKPGVFWVGTLGGGLFLADKKGRVLQSLKSNNGLPSDVVCAIEKDRMGNIWMGTSKGIAYYQQKEKKITFYTKADGLAGSQVNFGAVFRTSKGDIIFGTTDGFSLFDPQGIQTRGANSNIVLTGLTINNKKVSVRDEDSPIPMQLDELPELKLKYFQNSLSIDFINTTPSFSGEHLYSWKLQGFDKEWSRPSTVANAVYTNLGYGRYTLQIKTFSKGSVENNFERRLNIIISRPWWLTIWAYLGYIMLLSGSGLFVYNFFKVKYARKKFAERLRLNTGISHEIRTPLTLIKGPVNALATIENLSPEQKGNLLLAQKNIQKLESVINQFIDYQKAGIDKLQVQVRNDNIIPLIDEAVESFMPLLKEKNIHFTYKKPSEDIYLLFDRDKMQKVLNNLLSNAIKYTPTQKEIELEISKEAKFVMINVSDTGIGIPETQQHLLFKGYFRADNTINLKETGSGIGLSVAKELVEVHHGKLSFKSRQGHGSTFTIRLPLHNESLFPYLVKGEDIDLQSSPIRKPEMPGKAASRKLLVVEDNDELRNYLVRQLSLNGYIVSSAANGADALALVKRKQPELIITDIMMPEMNGFQLCEKLKEDINTCHIPVIMLTAIHDRDYLIEGYRAGADDYVRKPFELDYICARIENLLENRARFRTKILSVFEQHPSVVQNDGEIAWLRDVTEIILENIENTNFSVEELSNKMATSRPVLFRKFKTITGEAPHQYIQKLRLRKSVELLQAGKLNINEIAFECGFSDPKYFSTHFKKHFGKSPTEFKKTENL